MTPRGMRLLLQSLGAVAVACGAVWSFNAGLHRALAVAPRTVAEPPVEKSAPLEPRPAVQALSYATVYLRAEVSRIEARTRVQLLEIGPTCLEGSFLLPDAGSSAYVLAPAKQASLVVQRLVCAPVRPDSTASSVPAPGGEVVGIDGHRLETQQKHTSGLALGTYDAPWVLTASALRVDSRLTAALSFSRGQGAWTIQVPGMPRAPSVAALLSEQEVQAWRGVFPPSESQEIVVEDGTAAEPSADSSDSSSLEPASDAYAPL